MVLLLLVAVLWSWFFRHRGFVPSPCSVTQTWSCRILIFYQIHTTLSLIQLDTWRTDVGPLATSLDFSNIVHPKKTKGREVTTTFPVQSRIWRLVFLTMKSDVVVVPPPSSVQVRLSFVCLFVVFLIYKILRVGYVSTCRQNIFYIHSQIQIELILSLIKCNKTYRERNLTARKLVSAKDDSN